MPRTLNEGLASSPTFTPHRANVTAADTATLSDIPQHHGLMASQFDQVLAQVHVEHASPDVDVEVLTYSDASGQFVPMSPAQKFEGLTGPAVIRFSAGGQRFFLHVSGTFDVVGISVAGVPLEEQIA